MFHPRKIAPVRVEPGAARRPGHRLPSAAVAASAMALAVAVGACGGSSTKTTATSATSTTVPGGPGTTRANGAALQAFRTCMQAQGVTVPTAAPRPPGQTQPTTPGDGTTSGTGGGGGGFGRGFGGGGLGGVFASTDPKTQAAVKSCQGTLPAGFLQAQTARMNAQAAFVSCMKDHGVTITTTAPGAGPSPATPPSTIDQTTPAYKICAKLRPARPGNGGGQGNGGSGNGAGGADGGPTTLPAP